MPDFKYVGTDLNSKKVKGVFSATNGDEMITSLYSKGILVESCYEIPENRKPVYRLKKNELSDFSQELSTMIESGISIIKALEIMLRRDIKLKIKEIYTALYDEISNGMTLSEAMKNQGQSFPPLIVNMFKSGEESGTLDLVSSKMAVYYTKEHRLEAKIKSALMYPKILMGLLVVVVIVIFTIILPNFFKLFKDIELPLVTRIVVGISYGTTHYWYLILLLSAIIAGLISYIRKIPSVRYSLDKTKLSLPIIGKLNRIICTARFSRTLSSLYSSGMSMIAAIPIAVSTIGNSYIESQFPKVIEDIRNGEPLSSSLEKIDGFDIKLALSVFVGQESGQLNKMLDSTADSFDYEAEIATQKLVTIIEPVMIVFMAVIVGFIALSVLLPIITLYQNIG